MCQNGRTDRARRQLYLMPFFWWKLENLYSVFFFSSWPVVHKLQWIEDSCARVGLWTFRSLHFRSRERNVHTVSCLYGRRGNGWQTTVAASSLLHGDFEQRHWPVLSHWASTLRTARCAHVASPTGLSIGYWFSVNRATSAFNISADFLIAINVLFNFHFKRTLVI